MVRPQLAVLSALLTGLLAAPGCVLDRRGQSASARYERELKMQGARLSSLEQQFDDLDGRLTRVEELTQARGEQDLVKLQTLEQVRAEIARLRGEVELLRHDVDTHNGDAGRRLEDAAFRLAWLETRAEQLEKSLGLAPPPPPEPPPEEPPDTDDSGTGDGTADTPPVDLGLAPRDLPQPPPTLRSGAPQPQLLLEHAPAPSDWTDGHWQAALWQSARLLESLDGVLHRLLASLDASLHGQNTVVVLTAAQGSPLARHGRLRPDDLSEGSVRVPLAVRWPWERAPESIATPVSLLDLAPTLCAVLGIPGLPDARGLNLRPLLDGYPAPRRTEVVTEGFVEGRSVRSREFRHTTWRDDPVARLTHLPSDPHEERNLADNPGYSSTVDTHREALRLWEAGLRLVPGAKAGWPGDLR